MTFKWYENATIFLAFIYLFFFKTNGTKGYLKRTNSVTVMVIFFESSILKVTWLLLQLRILRTWITIPAKSFAETLVNIVKQKSMKISENIPVAQKFELVLLRTLNQNRSCFTYFIRYFLWLFISTIYLTI